MKQRRLSNGMFRMLFSGLALTAFVGAYLAGDAFAITCERDVRADVVVIDTPIMFNRLGAGNPNATIYALRRDVIFSDTQLPLTVGGRTPVATNQAELYELRPDRRPRPMALRVRKGDCLTVNLQNLLKPAANPRQFLPPADLLTAAQTFTVPLDEQPLDRVVGFHAAGMQLVTSIDDDGSMVGKNHLGLPGSQGTTNTANGSLAGVGETKSYKLYAEKEGVFLVTSEGVLIGSDGNEGHVSNGLFGQLIVEPAGAPAEREGVPLHGRSGASSAARAKPSHGASAASKRVKPVCSASFMVWFFLMVLFWGRKAEPVGAGFSFHFGNRKVTAKRSPHSGPPVGPSA